jgi:LPS sulfotransferase NodH
MQLFPAFTTMNRFTDRVRPRRIAALVTYKYPSPEQASVYDELEAIGDQLDAEVGYFHTAIHDPRTLPAELKHRLGNGLLVPWPPPSKVGDAEIDHFRQFAPHRFDQLVHDWTIATGEDTRTMLQRPEVRAAFAYSRLIQAWAPDLLCIRYLNSQALFGVFGSCLLGIPLVAWNSPQGEAVHNIGKILHDYASCVVEGSPASLAASEASFGTSIGNKFVVADSSDAGRRAIVAFLSRLCATPRANDLPALGPKAAFVTPLNSPPATEEGVKPFLVLGTERTGSNMLVDMLAGQPDFACAGELFNPRSIKRGELAWVGDVEADMEQLLWQQVNDPVALHHSLLRDSKRAGATWAGYKLLYFHGIINNEVISCLTHTPDLKIVHLVRRSRLRRWLSHYKAQVLDSWYTRKGTEPGKSAGPLELDPIETATDFAYVEMLEERYRALFTNADILELDYADFTRDLASTRKKLGVFFGVEMAELRPRSKKTGEAALAKGIANLAQLREAFRGTRWETQFDD